MPPAPADDKDPIEEPNPGFIELSVSVNVTTVPAEITAPPVFHSKFPSLKSTNPPAPFNSSSEKNIVVLAGMSFKTTIAKSSSPSVLNAIKAISPVFCAKDCSVQNIDNMTVSNKL